MNKVQRLHHLALKVNNHDELRVLRDRLRSKGVPVVGPMDHGFCVSICFAGPESLSLELSYSEAAINLEAWIDPEVRALAGISDEELVRYKQSAACAASIAVPDEVMWANSENEPPLTLEGS